MKRLVLNAFLFVFNALLFSCGTSDLVRPEVIVRSGTFFGMCAGYCRTEVEISADSTVTLRAALRDIEQYPEKRCTSPTNAEEWQALEQVADLMALRGLPETIGCPDCLDGGGEWVEIEEGGKKYRVTFDHGADIPAIQPLLDQVREVRGRNVRQCQ